MRPSICGILLLRIMLRIAGLTIMISNAEVIPPSAVITKVEGEKGTINGANVTLDTLAPEKQKRNKKKEKD